MCTKTKEKMFVIPTFCVCKCYVMDYSVCDQQTVLSDKLWFNALT